MSLPAEEVYVIPIAIVLGIIVAAGAAITIGTLMLPETRSGSTESVISASPEAIIAVVKDVGAQPKWRSSVAAIAEDATGWTETTRIGERIAFRWVHQAPDRLDLSFSSESGYAGTWTARLTRESGGTRMRVTETANLTSPVTRLLAYLFFDPVSFSRKYLAELKARVEVSNE
jgi:hypothetical protein